LEPSSPVAEPELESAAVIPDVVAVPVASEAQETGGQDSVPADAPDADRIDPLETAPTCFVEEVADALELTTADDDVAGNLPADADDAEPATRRRRRRRGRRRRREDSADDAPAGEDQEDAAEAGDVVDERDAEAPAIASEPDADSEERRPKRRRRKRRRTPREANRETADADDTPSADDDEPDDSEDDDQDLDDDDTAGEGVRPKHRRIPSWGEAIDHIVSNNMASRSRNSGGGQRHRGRK
jgi:ribonuclease E